VAVYQSTYFDGNLSATIGSPTKFRAEYDRYYYQPTPDWVLDYGFLGYGGYGFGRGFGYGYFGSFSAGSVSGSAVQSAAPLSGW
jgi:hypothetical protein